MTQEYAPTGANTHRYASIAGVRLWVLFVAISVVLLAGAWFAVDRLAERTAEKTVIAVATELSEADAALIGESFRRILENESMTDGKSADEILTAVGRGDLNSLVGLMTLIGGDQGSDLETLLAPLDIYHMILHLPNGAVVWEQGATHDQGALNHEQVMQVAQTHETVSNHTKSDDFDSPETLDLVGTFVPLVSNSGETSFVFHLTRDVTEDLAAHTVLSKSQARLSSFSVIGVVIAILGIFVFIADRRISAGGARIVVTERLLSDRLNLENEELQRVDKIKNEFLSGLSHELKTPLAAVLGFTQILKKNRPDNLVTQQIEQLETIDRNGKRLDNLIGDLLELSRIEGDRFTLDKTSFDAVELARDLANSFGPIVRDRNQTLQLNAEIEDAWVEADSGRMSQVLSNLISNASKYSPRDTEIRVDVKIEYDQLLLSVNDQGPGITEEDQDRLFDMFFRTTEAHNSSIPGTGIGLYVSKRIVEMHGGELTVASFAGKGTTMTVAIPGLTTDIPQLTTNRSSFTNRLEEIQRAI